jgi:hypothetical protein
MTDDEDLRALHRRRLEQEQQIKALAEVKRELKRKYEANLARLTPRERAIFEAELELDEGKPTKMQ